MLKNIFMASTAIASVVLIAGHAHAQESVASGIVPIQGISKSSGAGGGTPGESMKKKIPLKSQYAASHISRQEIEQESPVATADSILNKEPSINATAAGPLGMEENITFRSFNAAEFTQTYDGIALNDIFNGGVTNNASLKNRELVTPNDFDSVDIYRGVNNPATNSYDSLGGTINYNSIKPTATPNARLQASYGSFHTFDYNASLNTGDIGGLSQYFAFERGDSTGWLDNNKERNNNLYYAFNKTIDPTGKIYGNFIFDQNSGDIPYDEPTALISQYGRQFQVPTSIYREPVQNTDYQAIFGVTQQLADNVNFDLKGFFGTEDFNRTSYSNPAYQATGYYIPNKDILKNNPYTLYEYYGTTAGIQPKFTVDLPYNIITFGGNYTIGHLHSAEFIGKTEPVTPINGDPYAPKGYTPGNTDFNEHDTRTLYSIYVQDEIDLLNDKLKITPGVKYLYANTKNEDADSYSVEVEPNGLSNSDVSHFTSPTFGLSYEFLPNTVAYFAYGQNIEFPTISAFYGSLGEGADYNQAAPVNLQPEHVIDYEAGLRYRNDFYGFTGALGFYQEDFSKTFITAQDPNNTSLTETINGGSSVHKGIELQATEDFGDKHLGSLDVGDYTAYFNYSYANAYYTGTFKVSTVGSVNAASAANVVPGTPLALVPQDVVNFGGTWYLNGYRATADARYVTSQFITESGGTTSSLKEPAYFTLNLGISKTIPVRLGTFTSVKFQLNADNVLNRVYDAYAYSESEVSEKTTGPYNTPSGLPPKSTYASVQLAAPQAFYGSITLQF
jgi:outer membrane receptor protein involved in Fe transport